MFKTKEELINAVDPHDEYDEAYNAGVVDGVIIAFKSMAERKKFFMTYRDYSKFMKEQPKLHKEWIEFEENNWKAKTTYHGYYNARFEDWLFDLCFGDV